MGGRNKQAMIKRDKKLIDNDTKGSEYSPFEDEMLDIADDSGRSAMGIFLGNYDFGICSLDNETSSGDHSIPTLHHPNWSKYDTDSYYDNDDDYGCDYNDHDDHDDYYESYPT